MSIDSVDKLHDKQDTGPSVDNKVTRLEIDNAYLAQQNDHLQRELSFARYTINALKTITQQKEMTIDETKLELERAYLRIKMLGISMMRQQQLDQQYYERQQQLAGPISGAHNNTTGTMIEEDKPMLIMDADSSDDQQELSDEDETIAHPPQPSPASRRPLSNIMSKLPLRQQPTMVFENQNQQLASPPTTPVNYNL